MRRFIKVLPKEDSDYPERFGEGDLFSVEGNFGFHGSYVTADAAYEAANVWRAELEKEELGFRIFIEVAGIRFRGSP